jgi:putative endonuclease
MIWTQAHKVLGFPAHVIAGLTRNRKLHCTYIIDMKNEAFLYFMANNSNTALYIGVTNNIVRRVAEHKAKIHSGFTQKYNCMKLVYFEAGDLMIDVIKREKQIKNWKRAWKNELVKQMNPEWRDLSWEIGVTVELVQEIKDQAANNACCR